MLNVLNLTLKPMTEPLSTAALVVLWAGLGHDSDRLVIAAALRAAADHGEYMVDPVDGKTAVVRVSDLQSWAAELEGGND